MAKRNSDDVKAVIKRPGKDARASPASPSPAPKARTKNACSPTPTKADPVTATKRSSPRRSGSPQMQGPVSPSTSPGLSSGLYAGCKWSEPPSPSALPPPPQHWTQAGHKTIMLSCMNPASIQQDFAHQLKVLLKVHA